MADATNEAALLELAETSTAAHLETICRGLRRVVRDELGAVIASPAPERSVRERLTDDGMVRIEAQLSPDEAALVRQAIELARGLGGEGAVIGAADALLRVADAFIAGARDGQWGAERAQLVVHLRAELFGSATSREGVSAEAPSVDAPDADAHCTCVSAEEPSVDARAAAPATSCRCSGAPNLTSTGAFAAMLDDGSRLDADAFRRIACDAALLPILVDGSGLPIDVGRRTRVVSSALRRALAIRDGGCRFPGCDHRAWIDAHHVEHWAHGGETALTNLVSLCSAHHRLMHEGGFTVALEADGRAVFRRPDGIVVPSAPMLPVPTATLLDGAPAQSPLDDTTLLPRWDGRAPDYDACIAAARSRAA